MIGRFLLLAVVFILLALAFILLACNHATSGDNSAADSTHHSPPGEIQLEPPEMASITVDTVRVRTRRVVATLPAQLLLDEDRTVRVLSPVSGRILALDANPGDVVTTGHALAHIVSSDLAQAQSDEAKAEAASAQSANALVRAESLYAHQVIAQKDLEEARANAASDRAEAVRAVQRVDQLGAAAATDAGAYILRSPLSGTVVDRQANPGQEVSADANGPLFTISSLDTLWLTANAYIENLAQVRRGQHLVFTTPETPNRRYDATVTYVGGALDSTTRTALVRATLANPGRALHAGIFGDVRLYAPDTSRAVGVPVTALVTSASETVVFVETAPRRFVRRPVMVGEDDGDIASITEGLAPGERVVTRGSILLEGRLTQGS